MTGAPTSTGPGGQEDDSGELARPRPNVVQISTYTPPPGADIGIRSQVAYGGPVVFAHRARPWRVLLIVVVVAGILGFGGTWIYNTVRRAQHRTTADAASITSVAGAPTTAAATDSPSTAVAPPPTLPAAGSLYDPNAAPLIGPAVEAAAPGEPSAFTSIAIYPAYALATVRDPANATRTIRLTIRGGDVVDDEPVTQSVDVQPSLFGVGDVDWSKIAPLVAGAPTAANAPADTVDHVVLQRWGFDPAFPMRILVYLSGGQLIEAGTDGAVVAVH